MLLVQFLPTDTLEEAARRLIEMRKQWEGDTYGEYEGIVLTAGSDSTVASIVAYFKAEDTFLKNRALKRLREKKRRGRRRDYRFTG